jgi:hypothetical protein
MGDLGVKIFTGGEAVDQFEDEVECDGCGKLFTPDRETHDNELYRRGWMHWVCDRCQMAGWPWAKGGSEYEND